MPGDAIVFEGVVKTYGSFHALDGLSFRVREGELYGLLGPNGAGKTTAIRVITGLQRATAGKAQVLGRAPTDEALRPLIGYMPQETALYVDMTARENLQFFGALYGLRGKDLAERIDDVLSFVDLSKWGDTVVTDLSGGMKHRTSLAAALLPRPKLLVLDEPTVGVDPELRAAFWKHFEALGKRGTTVLLTTHYMDEARRCARVGFLRRGKLIAEDSPDGMLRQAGVDNLEDAFLRLAGQRAAPMEGSV